MGRFTLPMLLDFSGFRRILTILARGYLFRADSSACDRIETARRALLAWCRLSAEKKSPRPKTTVSFREGEEKGAEKNNLKLKTTVSF